MSFVYIKIPDLQNKDGKDMYYQSPISTKIVPAEIFNDKYIYFLKTSQLDIDKDNMRSLGKYVRDGWRNSGYRADDYDYEVYEFSEDYIAKYEKNNIYCQGLPEDGSDFVLIKDIFYKGNLPVLYKIG